MSGKCIIYCRVSTGKQAKEGESLERQEKGCKAYAKKKWLEVVRVFSEPISWKADVRPVFNEVLTYLKENSWEVDYLIVRDIVRFTRGWSLSYENMKADISKYGVELLDTYYVIQPSKNTLDHLWFEYGWSKHSPSWMAETLQAEYWKAEIRELLTRVVWREIELTMEWYRTRPPNDWYRNKKIVCPEGKKKTIQVPDPERWHYIVSMFELRAQWEMTDQEIADKINSMGYRTKVTNKWNKDKSRVVWHAWWVKLTVKRLQGLIKNLAYCWIVCEKWTKHRPIKASYEWLVSTDIFNKANRWKIFVKEKDWIVTLLYNQKTIPVVKRRNKNNPFYPFKSVVLCPKCKRPLLGSGSTWRSWQKFPAYHCNRSHKSFRVPKSEFEESIRNFIKSLRFKKEFMNTFKIVFLDTWHKKQKETLDMLSSINTTISELEDKQSKQVDALTQATSPCKRSILGAYFFSF